MSKMNKAKTCKSCQEAILEDTDLLTCSVCKHFFHFYCVGQSENKFRLLTRTQIKNLKCNACYSVKESDLKENPEKNQSEENEKHKQVPSSEEKVKSEMLEMMMEIKTENAKLKDFIKKEFENYEKTLSFHGESIQEMSSTLKQLSSEYKNLQKDHDLVREENKQLKSEVNQLKIQITDLQQYSRRLNLEISNLPETETEDIKDVVSKVFSSLQLDLIKNVSTCHRVPSSKKDKPKPIIVQFDTKANRDLCLKTAKAKHLNTTDVNPKFVKNPIYLNEHLTPELKKIFYYCRKFKTENHMKFCWIKDGKIFLRQNESSRVYRIVSTDDLLNVTNVPTQ